MEVMPVASQPIYQFYAELKDYKPLIWRRFQVAGNITLAQLGYAGVVGNIRSGSLCL